MKDRMTVFMNEPDHDTHGAEAVPGVGRALCTALVMNGCEVFWWLSEARVMRDCVRPEEHARAHPWPASFDVLVVHGSAFTDGPGGQRERLGAYVDSASWGPIINYSTDWPDYSSLLEGEHLICRPLTIDRPLEDSDAKELLRWVKDGADQASLPAILRHLSDSAALQVLSVLCQYYMAGWAVTNSDSDRFQDVLTLMGWDAVTSGRVVLRDTTGGLIETGDLGRHFTEVALAAPETRRKWWKDMIGDVAVFRARLLAETGGRPPGGVRSLLDAIVGAADAEIQPDTVAAAFVEISAILAYGE